MQVYSCTLLNHVNGALNSYVSVQHHLPTYGPETAYVHGDLLNFGWVMECPEDVPFSFVFCNFFKLCYVTAGYCHVVLQTAGDFNHEVGHNS